MCIKRKTEYLCTSKSGDKGEDMKKRESFTLIELIVVVIIIGIMASIAMPQYFRVRERAMDKKAVAILNHIRAAEKQYRAEMESYYFGATNVTQINGNLSLEIADDGNWNYTITGGQNSFTAILDRNRAGFDRDWTITSWTANATCSGNCP